MCRFAHNHLASVHRDLLVDAALSVLGKLNGRSSYTKPRRTLSASARRRISLAQKARWAKAKGYAPKPKRTMSASARRKIAAAQRARWAKIRAKGKKAASGQRSLLRIRL